MAMEQGSDHGDSGMHLEKIDDQARSYAVREAKSCLPVADN